MRRAALASLALLVLSCKSAPQPFSQPPDVTQAPVRIDFRPPLGQEVKETSVIVRAEHAPGAANAEETVTAQMQSRFEEDGKGFKLTQRVTEVKVTSNGQPVESPLVSLVTRFPLVVKLASDGTFVQLLNPEDAEQAVRETFPDPQQQEAVLRYFTPSAVEDQARADWNTRYGEFLGREVSPGMVWYGLESVGTSAGEDVFFLLERKVKGVRQGEKGRELVVELSCPVDVKTAAKPEQAQAVLDARQDPALEPTVKCHGEQVVALDPFMPLSNALELTAQPTLTSGTKVDVLLKRTVTASKESP